MYRHISAFLSALLVPLALGACGDKKEAPASPAERVAAADTATPGDDKISARAPLDFAGALRHTEEEIAHYERMAAAQPSSWMQLANAAQTYSRRALLTGDYGDYDRAAEALNRAAERTRPGAPGPAMAQARLAFTLHRFADAEAHLDRAAAGTIVPAGLRDEIAALRAAILFNRGHYAEAKSEWDRLAAAQPSTSLLSRQAEYYAKTGEIGESRRLLERAGTFIHGDPVSEAWLLLQRGILELESGELDAALKHFREADRALPGWYLIEEHIAEVETRKGDVKSAIGRYKDIVARTDNPEFMAALAAIYRERGDRDEAASWEARARSGFEALIESHPSAASGHAIDFFLEFGPPARALELAEKNYELRPNGEAALKLARAALASGDRKRAAKKVAEVRASLWRTPELEEIERELAAP